MSANDHLSPDQFTRVYRGIYAGYGNDTDAREFHDHPLRSVYGVRGSSYGYARPDVGIHWTDVRASADRFASGGEDPDDDGSYDRELSPGKHHLGVVLHGRVRNSSVLQPGTEEYQDYADTEGILDHSNPEAEVPLRGGSPIRISHIETISEDSQGNYRSVMHRYGRTARA